MKDRHLRDEPVKDAAQDVAEDVAEDVTQDVSGAAEDRSVKVLIVARVIFHRPHAFLGRQVKDEHVKDAAHDAAEGVAEGVSQNAVQELAFGARAARAFLASPPPPPPPPPPSLCTSR